MTIRQGDKIVAGLTISGDYNDLKNKPHLENIELSGTRSLEEFGISTDINTEVEAIKKDTKDLIENVNILSLALNTIKDRLNTLENNTGLYNVSTEESLKRQERNKKLENVLWRVERYEQQVKLGIETVDDENTYKDLLKYIQYLRDIPQDKAFPKIEILTFEEYLTTI